MFQKKNGHYSLNSVDLAIFRRGSLRAVRTTADSLCALVNNPYAQYAVSAQRPSAVVRAARRLV